MDKCPNCGKLLTEDEKILYKCMTCKQQIKIKQHYVSFNNTIAKSIKIFGIIIIIIGTVLSFIIANNNSYGFSLIHFFISEILIAISGLLFIGISEIIQLLQDIKNKM